MQYQPLSLTARTLYAELNDLALALGATEHIGRTPGTVVRKTVHGHRYIYYQYRDLDGRTRQSYLGRDAAEKHLTGLPKPAWIWFRGAKDGATGCIAPCASVRRLMLTPSARWNRSCAG